jgi:hypothetical protein
MLTHHRYRFAAAAAAALGLAACGPRAETPRTDSVNPAIADSQPRSAVPADTALRRDSASGLSLPTDKGRPNPRP